MSTVIDSRTRITGAEPGLRPSSPPTCAQGSWGPTAGRELLGRHRTWHGPRLPL
jgi:hypothetical protein